MIVLATLPGETHGLGVQMAALVLAAAGLQVLSLGTEVPTPQIAQVCKDVQACALALSVSSSTGETATVAKLRRLRQALPRRVTMIVGGSGASEVGAGVEVVQDLQALDARARAILAAP